MTHYEDCKFFMRGACTRGLHCGFRHSETASKTELICQEWAIGKWCKGDCNLRHPSALELGALAAAAAAAGSGRKTATGFPPSSPLPCKFYARGRCTKGESCPFLHADQPVPPTPPRSPQPAILSLRAAAAAAHSNVRAEANTNAKAHDNEPLAQSRTVEIPPVSSVTGQASPATASAAAKAKADEILRKHKLPRAMNDGQAQRPHRGATAGVKRIRGDSSLSRTERDSSDLEELRKISPSDQRSPQSGETITGRLQGVPGSSSGAAGRDLKTGGITPTVSAAGISAENENHFPLPGGKASIAESTLDTGTVSVASASKSGGGMDTSAVLQKLADASAMRGPDADSAGSPSTAPGTSRLELTTPGGAGNATSSPRRTQDARISGTSPERSPTQSSKEVTRNAVVSTGLEQTTIGAKLEGGAKVLNGAQRAPAHEDPSLTLLSSGEQGAVVRRASARTLVGDEGDGQYRCWSLQSPAARETGLDEGNAAIIRGDCRDGPQNDAGLQRDDQAPVSAGTVSRSRQDCSGTDEEQVDRNESVVDKHCRRIISRVNEDERIISPLDVPPSTVPPAPHALSAGKMITTAGSGHS